MSADHHREDSARRRPALARGAGAAIDVEKARAPEREHIAELRDGRLR